MERSKKWRFLLFGLSLCILLRTGQASYTAPIAGHVDKEETLQLRRRQQEVSSYWTTDRIRNAKPADHETRRRRPTNTERALLTSSSNLVVARHMETPNQYLMHWHSHATAMECTLDFQPFTADESSRHLDVSAADDDHTIVKAIQPHYNASVASTSPYMDLAMDVRQPLQESENESIFVWLDLGRTSTLHPLRLRPIHGSGRYTLRHLGPFPTSTPLRWTVSTTDSLPIHSDHTWSSFSIQPQARNLRRGRYSNDYDNDTSASSTSTPNPLALWLEYLTPVSGSTVSNPVEVTWKLNHPSGHRVETVYGLVQQEDSDKPETEYWTRVSSRSLFGSAELVLHGKGPVTLTFGIRLDDGTSLTAPPIQWSVYSEPCSVPMGYFDDSSKSLYKAVGRLFMSLGGDDYQCSGTLVEGSDDRFVIVTAAHCIFRKQVESFHYNVMFLPGHGQNGNDDDCTSNPERCIYPLKGIIPTEYVDVSKSASWEVDYGFWVAPNDASHDRELRSRRSKSTPTNPRIDSFIKPMGISFDPMYVGKKTSLFGFPLDEDPYFMYSVGGLDDTPFPEEEGYFLACSGLREGSSGGPWTQSISRNGDIVVGSINSWTWDDGSPGTGGPRLDTGGAACVYNAANQATLDNDRLTHEIAPCPR